MIRKINESTVYRDRCVITCGVADITDAGIGGIVVGWGGCLANNEANILFLSQSLLVALVDVPEEDT